MFNTSQYTINACECGIPLTFELIRPLKEKLADIVSFQISNSLATVTTKSPHNIAVGTMIEIFSVSNIPVSITNKFMVSAVTSNSVSFVAKAADRVLTNGIGYIYSIPNIEPKNRYFLKFTKELSVPSSAEVVLTPSNYSIESANNFIPETVVNIVSKFTTSSKTIIKLSITDEYNQVLYTEYKQIICSQSAEKPCEIIAKKPFVPTSIYLNRSNNWTYIHNGFVIAQFVPNKDLPFVYNLVLTLDKQNDALLPSITDSDKLTLKIDPIAMQNRSVTRDQLKSIILNNPISASEQRNINIEDSMNEWTVQGSGLTADQLKNLVIVVSKEGQHLIIDNVADAQKYVPKPQPIPAIMFLKWSTYNEILASHIEYNLGQMIYNSDIYENKNLVLTLDPPSSSIPQISPLNFKLINFVSPNYET